MKEKEEERKEQTWKTKIKPGHKKYNNNNNNNNNKKTRRMADQSSSRHVQDLSG
jgi:hypothetical protein